MTAETVMAMTYQALLVALAMAGPLLIITLIVGLTISVFQAATQINEMTLSFIPKMLTMCVTVVLLGPWLLGLMTDYMRQLLTNIPQIVG